MVKILSIQSNRMVEGGKMEDSPSAKEDSSSSFTFNEYILLQRL